MGFIERPSQLTVTGLIRRTDHQAQPVLLEHSAVNRQNANPHLHENGDGVALDRLFEVLEDAFTNVLGRLILLKQETKPRRAYFIK